MEAECFAGRLVEWGHDRLAGWLYGCLGLLFDQPAVVRHHLALRQVERHLQGHQNSELERNELSPADPETLLQFLSRDEPEGRGGRERRREGRRGRQT